MEQRRQNSESPSSIHFRYLNGFLLTILFLVGGCGSDEPAEPAGASSKKPPVVTSEEPEEKEPENLSFFEDDYKGSGKDPFFPESNRRLPEKPVDSIIPTGPLAPAKVEFKLIMVMDMGKASTARIENRTFRLNQERDLIVNDTKYSVKLLEISKESVTIQYKPTEGRGLLKKVVLKLRSLKDFKK